jgi:putative peptidoglycan lipid II flippase
LRRDDVYVPEAGWGAYLLRLLLANLIMALVLLAGLYFWNEWTSWPWWQRAVRMAAMVAAGAGSYGLILLLSGLRPRHFRATS